MYATDQIYLARLYAEELQADRAQAEADRWEWQSQHGCTKDRIAIMKLDGSVFTEPCCIECYNKVWKHESAAILHNHSLAIQAA